MYTKTEKVQDSTKESAESQASRNQSNGKPTFQFLDNRPSSIAQTKLQSAMNQSSQILRLSQLQSTIHSNSCIVGQQKQLERSHNSAVQRNEDKILSSGDVIQRYLDIEGDGVFEANDQERFHQQYTDEAIGEMLRAIQEEGEPRRRFPDIQTTLASPDVIMIGGTTGEYYVEFIESERLPVTGGAQRNAGDHASYASRPAQGFEDLHLSGLMNCIAIAVETRDQQGVSGIAMAHFTTPRGIDGTSKQLTPHGNMVLNGMRNLVPGGIAHLRWNQGSPEERDDPSVSYLSGQSAANIVAFALHARGILTHSIESLSGGTCRYRLNNDGTAGWK